MSNLEADQLETHLRYMREALQLAEQAAAIGEVPIGALVVKEGNIIGRGFNRRETLKTPLGHAELIAIEEAAQTLGGWRLENCSLYVTLEPCPMCAGAIVQARIETLIYGAKDPKAGYAGSLYNTLQDERLNHQTEVISGVCAEACSAQLKQFFQVLREKKRGKLLPLSYRSSLYIMEYASLLMLKRIIKFAVLDGEVAVPCNLQSARAGLNSYSRFVLCKVWLMKVVLTNGSYATEPHEPRQVRKEAAVSGSFRVPQGSLFRANYMGTLG